MITTHKKSFILKREIDIGQILTVISILGSLVGFGFAWNNDRSLKDKEYADRVRRSASVVTAKVERWAELSDRYFEDLQPTLVDVSEKVTETHSRQPANRMLFKGLMDAKAKASQRIVDEQLQIAYMELYGYVPAFQGVFDRTIAEIRNAEVSAQEALRTTLQASLVDPNILAETSSSQVGNVLRNRTESERQKLRSHITEISRPLREKMLNVIQLKDGQLRNAQEQSESITLFAPTTSASKISK